MLLKNKWVKEKNQKRNFKIFWDEQENEDITYQNMGFTLKSA